MEAAQLLDAYVRAMQRLVQILLAAVRAQWRGLPGYDRVDEPDFINAVVPLVLGGERQAVALTRALIAGLSRSRPVSIDVGQIVGTNLRGVEPEIVYQRPFIEVRKELSNGRLWKDAVMGGEQRALSTVETDIQLVKRATSQAVQDAQPNLFGFRRVAQPDACAFCRLLASKGGAYVKSADAFPIHPHCRCTLVPLVEPHPGAVFLPDGTRIREQRGGPIIEHAMPEGVAVSNHGELGAVVHDPEHHFQGQLEAA